MSLLRMKNAVLRHTLHRAAHVRRLRQSTKHSMNRNHTAGLSFDEAMTLLVLALNVRLQSTHSQRWEPSLPCPFLLMWTEPQRTHASGFSGSPNGIHERTLVQHVTQGVDGKLTPLGLQCPYFITYPVRNRFDPELPHNPIVTTMSSQGKRKRSILV